MADWRASSLFTPAERAALEFADGLTLTPAVVSDQAFAEARRHFSEQQIVELAATVAMENYRARLNRAFLVEAEGRYRPESGS